MPLAYCNLTASTILLCSSFLRKSLQRAICAMQSLIAAPSTVVYTLFLAEHKENICKSQKYPVADTRDLSLNYHTRIQVGNCKSKRPPSKLPSITPLHAFAHRRAILHLSAQAFGGRLGHRLSSLPRLTVICLLHALYTPVPCTHIAIFASIDPAGACLSHPVTIAVQTILTNFWKDIC